MRKAIRWILIILCVAAFCYSAFMLLSTLFEYRQADRFYDRTALQYATVVSPAPQASEQKPAVSQPEADSEDAPALPSIEKTEPELPSAPIAVDFASLLELNSEVVGWLYCEDTVINYPIVRAADNNKDLHRLEPQRLWMHPRDAAERELSPGDEVLVYNDRGRIRIPVYVTERIMPGVVGLPQGAWYDPDADGTDRAGSINVLTSQRPTPYARGNAQHTNLVQVEKL